MPPPIAPVARLRAGLDRLAEAVEAARFELASPARASRRALAEATTRSLRRYLLPRLADLGAPLLVVVFGPTGSGKSTLVNSLAGREITVAGALRPTTRQATVWCHRRHRERYETGALAMTGPVAIQPDDHPLLDRLTVVDTPDIDSHVVEHRRQTEAVLAMADAAIYVTTAQRYADAVPWEVLGDLARRGTPLLVVANRLSRRSGGAIADLASLMREGGVDSGARTDRIVTIQEQRLRGEARLPSQAVKRVATHLEGLATAHQVVVREAVTGALGVALADARQVAEEVAAQRAEGETLWEAARLGYRHQAEEVANHLERGELVREEVVARWQRLVGVTDLARIVARGAGRVRDLLVGGQPVRSGEVQQVEREARQELVDLVAHRARRAVTAAVNAWELDPAGRGLLTDDLRRVGKDTPEHAAVEIDGWLAGLVELVREQGEGRFRLARAASVGVNAAAVVLLIGVFASTGGVTGGELGVAAGAAAAQQSLLEHLFGGAAARRLATRARLELVERIGKVLEEDAARYREAVEAALDPPHLVDEMQEATRSAELEAEALHRG